MTRSPLTCLLVITFSLSIPGCGGSGGDQGAKIQALEEQVRELAAQLDEMQNQTQLPDIQRELKDLRTSLRDDRSVVRARRIELVNTMNKPVLVLGALSRDDQADDAILAASSSNLEGGYIRVFSNTGTELMTIGTSSTMDLENRFNAVVRTLRSQVEANQNLGRAAVVDMDSIAKALGVDSRLQRAMETATRQAEQRINQLRSELQTRIDQAMSTAGPAPTPQQRDALERLKMESTQRMQQAIAESQRNTEQTRQKILDDFRNQVRPAAQQVAQQRGFHLVFTHSDAMLAAHSTANLTDDVIKALRTPTSQSKSEEQAEPDLFAPDSDMLFR